MVWRIGAKPFKVESLQLMEGAVQSSHPVQDGIAKADLVVQRGKKHDTFVTSSSLDAARCAAGGGTQGWG